MKAAATLHIQRIMTLAQACQRVKDSAEDGALIMHSMLQKHIGRYGMKPPLRKGIPSKLAEKDEREIVNTIKLL